jgi:hypothetical protein
MEIRIERDADARIGARSPQYLSIIGRLMPISDT